MAFCSGCGQAMKEGAKFCGDCGTPVASNMQIPEANVVESIYAPKKVNPVSTALSVVSLFLMYIPSIFAHKKIEEGLAEMEANIFGSPRKAENTKIGIALLVFVAGLPLLSMLAILIVPQIEEIALFFCVPAAFAIFPLAYWIWKSSCRQRDRLLILAEQLGLTVIDTRGINLAFGCFGTWLWWLFIIMGAFSIYCSVGPVVRQYRTTAMFNEIAYTYNQYVAD